MNKMPPQKLPEKSNQPRTVSGYPAMNKMPPQTFLMSLCMVFLRSGTTTIITASSLFNIFDHLLPSSMSHNLRPPVQCSFTSSGHHQN